MHSWRKGISWILKENLLGASSIDMIDFRPARLVICGATDNVEETLLTPELGLFHGAGASSATWNICCCNRKSCFVSPMIRMQIAQSAVNQPVQKQKEPRDYSIGCHVSPKSRPVRSAPPLLLLCAQQQRFWHRFLLRDLFHLCNRTVISERPARSLLASFHRANHTDKIFFLNWRDAFW